MAIITRKKKKGTSYQVVVRDNKGAYYGIKTFNDKNLAKEYEGELIRKVRGGAETNSSDIRKVTIDEYYKKTWSIKCRAKVSDGWKGSQDQMFRDHIQPSIGMLRVVEVKKSHINDLLNDLETEKKLSGQTRRHIYNVLNSMFKAAVQIYEYRDDNPVLEKFKPEIEEIEQKYFKPEIARAFLDKVADHWLGPALWVMTIMGLRSGEIIGLQVGDIDFAKGTLTLRRQYRRKEKKLAALKNGKVFYVLPMPKELVRYLETKISPDAKPTDFFVQSPKKGGMLSYGTLYKALKYICKANNFDLLSPHGLRHTTSELWTELGASHEDLRRIFNHKDSKSTDNYRHVNIDGRLTKLANEFSLETAQGKVSLIR